MPLQTAPKADLSHIAGLKASSIHKSYTSGIVIKIFSRLQFSALLIPQEWLSFQQLVTDERRDYAPSLHRRKKPTKTQDCNSLKMFYTLTFYFTALHYHCEEGFKHFPRTPSSNSHCLGHKIPFLVVATEQTVSHPALKAPKPSWAFSHKERQCVLEQEK